MIISLTCHALGYKTIIMAVLYVVQESHYVLRLYFILLLLFYSKTNLRGY